MGSIAGTDDEYLDLVDDNDVVIGGKLRSQVYAEGLTNFRVVNAFLVNAQGEIWIPRRAAGKRIFPLCLDMSLGGHVESGETYEQALRREALEELNLDIDSVPCRWLGHLTPKANGVSAFMHVYELRSDEAPPFNEADFTEYFWLNPQSLLERLARAEKAKDDLPRLVGLFYGAA